jgi:hypothetical protein
MMREPAPRGPVVEIDELEKRIRAGAAPASAEAPRAARPDPLTELARLMQAAQAESDPYSRIFAEPPPRSPAAQNMPAGAAPHALEPSFAPLPPLPPLPSLPKRDPLSSRGLQEPTFTPPSAPIAPAPEFDYANVNLRGSLPPNSWNDQPAPGAPRPATQAPAVDAVPDARYDASYYGEAEEDWAADEQYAQAQYAEDQYAAYEDDYDYDTGPTAPASQLTSLARDRRYFSACCDQHRLGIFTSRRRWRLT